MNQKIIRDLWNCQANRSDYSDYRLLITRTFKSKIVVPWDDLWKRKSWCSFVTKRANMLWWIIHTKRFQTSSPDLWDQKKHSKRLDANFMAVQGVDCRCQSKILLKISARLLQPISATSYPNHQPRPLGPSDPSVPRVPGCPRHHDLGDAGATKLQGRPPLLGAHLWHEAVARLQPRILADSMDGLRCF